MKKESLETEGHIFLTSYLLPHTWLITVWSGHGGLLGSEKLQKSLDVVLNLVWCKPLLLKLHISFSWS